MIIPVGIICNTAHTMEMLLLALFASGLMIYQPVQGQVVQKDRCSNAGVVHLEGNGHYTLNFQQALELCQSLRYSLATMEQLSEAYNKGLRTCRYGWIDDQKIAFVPHHDGPNCTHGSNEVLSHAKEEDYLSDVYCFTQSELSCEDAINSKPPTSVSSQATEESMSTTTTKPDPIEDVFEEVMADGFILFNEAMTLPVQNKKSLDSSKAITSPPGPNPEENPSQWDSEQNTTIPQNAKVVNVVADVTTEKLKEISETPATVINKLNTIVSTKKSNEDNTTQTTSPDLEVTKMSTTTKLTSTESTNEMENVIAEGSGIYPETLSEEGKNRLLTPTTFHSSEGDLQPSTLVAWIPELEEGSGIQPEISTSSYFTTKSTTTVEEASKSSVHIHQDSKVTVVNEKPFIEAKGSRIFNIPHPAPEPTTSARVDESTPAWLIIFAFCMTLGAIVCVLAGIATKDMWYGPSRRRQNVTLQETNNEYGKAATLPLSVKEQELMTLMNAGSEQKNDSDFTVISLEEPPEKEYLM